MDILFPVQTESKALDLNTRSGNVISIIRDTKFSIGYLGKI